MNKQYSYNKKYRQTEEGKAKRRESRNEYYSRTSNAANHNNRYTLTEMKLIEDHSISDTELSQIIGRSVKAIQIKRSRIKKGA